MKKIFVIPLLFAFLTVSLTQPAKADDLGVFLKSCAIGTAGGALLGLASVALSENPSGHLGNVARGASLGLYAGIGFGLYTLYGQPARTNELTENLKNQIWFSSVRQGERIDGAQINWANFSF